MIRVKLVTLYIFCMRGFTFGFSLSLIWRKNNDLPVLWSGLYFDL